MPHYPVLQPDGLLAVWSTIVDNFVAFDCNQVEAVRELSQWHTGNLAEVTAKVVNGEIPFDHWNDWADCVAWAQFMHGVEDGTVKEAMQRTPDAMTRRYIEQFVATCKAESAADNLRHELAAANARTEKAEAELEHLDTVLTRYLSGYTKRELDENQDEKDREELERLCGIR
jgi:hypothetical protein